MPEFHLDYGSPEGAKQFRALDTFTQGYVEAMFFTSSGTPDDESLEDATFAELAPETLAQIIADCADFQASNTTDLEDCYAVDTTAYDAEHAGHDFWLTRNHHGAGFWDRGLYHGDKLTKIAHAYGSRDLYRGDDDLLYLM